MLSQKFTLYYPFDSFLEKIKEGANVNIIRTQAIVLKGLDLGEADRLITIFSREKGKLRIVANGVRRTRNNMSALVQPFTYNNVLIYKGSSIPKLRQGEILDSFLPLHEDLLSVASASYVIELIDLLLEEEDTQVDIFTLLLITLQIIKEQGHSDILLRYFELHLLSLLGYQPHLVSCVQCNKEMAANEATYFSAKSGGLKCFNCHDPILDGKISKASLSLMRNLLTIPLSRLRSLVSSQIILAETESIMENYIQYYTERKLKSLPFLRSLK